MKITWEVDDGYVGGRRPHTTVIDDEDFEDMADEEKDAYIMLCIQENFNQIISWYITNQE